MPRIIREFPRDCLFLPVEICLIAVLALNYVGWIDLDEMLAGFFLAVYAGMIFFISLTIGAHALRVGLMPGRFENAFRKARESGQDIMPAAAPRWINVAMLIDTPVLAAMCWISGFEIQGAVLLVCFVIFKPLEYMTEQRLFTIRSRVAARFAQQEKRS